MMLTLDEILERLSERFDPDFLVDLLEIDAETLLERFDDYVEAKRNRVLEALDD